MIGPGRPSLYAPDAEYLRLVASADAGTAARLLVSELAVWEGLGHGDALALPRLATTFVRARQLALAPALRDWLAADGSPVRCEIAGWFLWSYWPGPAVDVALVEQLLGVTAGRLDHQPVALSAVLLALASAARDLGGPLGDRVDARLGYFADRAAQFRLGRAVVDSIHEAGRGRRGWRGG